MKQAKQTASGVRKQWTKNLRSKNNNKPRASLIRSKKKWQIENILLILPLLHLNSSRGVVGRFLTVTLI